MKHLDRVQKLRTFLHDHPEGVTIEDIAIDQGGIGLNMARYIVRGLRLYLEAEDVPQNVPAESQGDGERWLYYLVDLDEQWWTENRLADQEKRLRTIRAVQHSRVVATNGSTREGRRARRTERILTFMIDTLAEERAELYAELHPETVDA